MQRLRVHAVAIGRTGTGSLMLLGERLTKALVVIIAILAVLAICGFNLTTVLAGLGIGGIAIALAAQKTLENLFGGISVLADEVIRVGDYCKFGDRSGTVEDISLRSTRIRTDDRTQLSIPNGAVATMSIENFARRDKIQFNPVLAIGMKRRETNCATYWRSFGGCFMNIRRWRRAAPRYAWPILMRAHCGLRFRVMC